jgi:uncharacterized protein YlxP (DUF503 family)
MFAGFARVALSIPKAGSLKDKRQVLHKVIDRVRARFNVAIAEVGDNDVWQRAEIGVAAVGNESAFVREVLDKVVNFIEEMYLAPVLAREVEVMGMNEFFGADDGSSFGSAARGTERTLAEAEADAEAEIHAAKTGLVPGRTGRRR